MSETPNAAEWAGTRGQQWCDHLAHMHAMLAPINPPLLEALALEDHPLRIADLACGGGATTAEIARRASPGSTVQGFDISPALTTRARASFPHLDFHVADLATAAPPGAPYDRLAARFGVMFFDDPPAAFGNLRRWLAPGGHLAFAVWADPKANRWLSLVREVVHSLAPLPPPVPDTPGPFRYADPTPLITLLTHAGFTDLNVHTWHGELPIAGGLPAPEAATFGLTAFSAFADHLAQAGEGAQQAAQQLLTTRLQPHERQGQVWLPAAVHIVTGG